jgi:hypothetical protein
MICRKISSIILIILVSIVPLTCRKLPQAPDKPANPLDPNNPDNIFNGTALVLSPSRVEIKANSQFTLELWVVEAEPIAGISAKIEFDRGKLQVAECDLLNETSFLLNNGGYLIAFKEINESYLQLDLLVVADTLSTLKNVSGKGIIAQIIFQHIGQDEVDISFSEESKLRNSQNGEVEINDFIAAHVVVTGP